MTAPGAVRPHPPRAMADFMDTSEARPKFKAGRLGEYTVGKDGEVILGKPTVFDRKNIDKFNF